jgi:hypothetical protein
VFRATVNKRRPLASKYRMNHDGETTHKRECVFARPEKGNVTTSTGPGRPYYTPFPQPQAPKRFQLEMSSQLIWRLISDGNLIFWGVFPVPRSRVVLKFNTCRSRSRLLELETRYSLVRSSHIIVMLRNEMSLLCTYDIEYRTRATTQQHPVPGVHIKGRGNTAAVVTQRRRQCRSNLF